jgi:arabinogalactan oligomer / maltooligosaccharide transport system substrate-binding protein
MRVKKSVIAVSLGIAMIASACGSSSTSKSAATAAPTVAPTPAPTAAPTTAAATAAPTQAPETTAAPTTSGAPTTTVYVPPKRGTADLVIWADATKAPVLRPLADAFAAKESLKISVLEVPSDKTKDELIKAGPAGEGPDIIIGAHDWLGDLVKAGAVAPIDLGATAAGFADVAVKAVTYDGKVYGLPYAIENVALFRNTDLVPTAPKTFEELEKVALDLKAAGKVDVPLAVQEGPADPYHNFPLFTALGGFVFKQNADGTYDPKQLGIDSPGALKAADAFAKWSKEGLISKDVTYDVMINSFGKGRAPFAITGPWAISQEKTGFKATGVHYAVEPIPPVAGGTPQVFVGVQAFMISAFSKNTSVAKSFLIDYLATQDAQVALYKAGSRPPALKSAFEAVKNDADIQGFGLAGQNGLPMPAIPAMGSVWKSWTDAYAAVFGGADPAKAFTDAAAAIRKEIG